MNILKKILQYFKLRQYQKYKKSPCPYCNKLNWKYCYAPSVQNNKKGVIEARVCGNCGLKDGKGYFISDKLKFNNNCNLKITK